MKNTLLILAIICTLVAILSSIVAGVKSVKFTNGCIAYLKLAGDAPTVERAEMFLKKVVAYIDDNNLNEGNSSIIIIRPTNDLEIWAGQMKAAYKIVSCLSNKENVDQLTKDNALMKIREVVNSHPDNVPFFPNQVLIVFLLWGSWLLTAFFWFWLFNYTFL